MTILTKFLQELNRDLTDAERVKLLDKHYHAEKFKMKIGIYDGKIQLQFRHNDNKTHNREIAAYLTLFIAFKPSDWNKILKKYDETISGMRISYLLDEPKWQSMDDNMFSARMLVKKGECLGFVSGVDAVFTNFKNVKGLKQTDYLVTRFDPIKWESNKCKMTKELDYI